MRRHYAQKQLARMSFEMQYLQIKCPPQQDLFPMRDMSVSLFLDIEILHNNHMCSLYNPSFAATATRAVIKGHNP